MNAARILFTTEHLFHPIRPLPLQKTFSSSKMQKLDLVISALALIVMGLLSVGIIPTLYLIGAHKKVRACENESNVFEKPRKNVPELNLFLRKLQETPQSKEEFTADKPPEVPVYHYDSSQTKQPKQLSWYNISHRPIGNFFFPSSNDDTRKDLCAERSKTFDSLSSKQDCFFKRISIMCDDKKIDAYIFAKKSNFANGRWTLLSNGHTGLCEYELGYQKEIFEALNSNYIVFNYPGMGCSEGETFRNNVIKAYQAVLSFIENQIDAKEIICWGTSMGGGVKGHAFKRHPFIKGKRYVSVSDQTYSTLANAVVSMSRKDMVKIAGYKVPASGFLTKQSGWQLSSKSSSSKLSHPEIVIHKATKLHPTKYEDIQDDNLFGELHCLAGHLLNQKDAIHWPTKLFVGTKDTHCGKLSAEEKKTIIHGIKEALMPGFVSFT